MEPFIERRGLIDDMFFLSLRFGFLNSGHLPIMRVRFRSSPV